MKTWRRGPDANTRGTTQGAIVGIILTLKKYLGRKDTPPPPPAPPPSGPARPAV